MTEGKDYLTLAEAAQIVGIKRASLYYYLDKLKIDKKQYVDNRHTYISKEDVERIRALRDEPWKVSREKPKDKAVV